MLQFAHNFKSLFNLHGRALFSRVQGKKRLKDNKTRIKGNRTNLNLFTSKSSKPSTMQPNHRTELQNNIDMEMNLSIWKRTVESRRDMKYSNSELVNTFTKF